MTQTDPSAPWWAASRERLIAALESRDCLYVYHLPTVRQRAAELKQLKAVKRVLYSMKANSHPQVLRAAHESGLGFECVSWAEAEALFEAVPHVAPGDILFTPNFAPRREYTAALERGARVTVDSLYPLQAWPETFNGREIFLRFNPDRPRGHHRHVHTAGPKAKFGLPLHDAEEAARLARAAGAKVAGLHAHAGSGVDVATHWHELATVLAEVGHLFPDAKILDVGGGVGVPREAGEPRIDLAALDAALTAFSAEFPEYELWMEPGRYISAECGVLLARVTQVKQAHGVRFIGAATGMNSLIRPALYEARHEIVNLTRLGEESAGLASIVGPICESADALGVDRPMPETREGDVLLIANAGAYGRVMASRYNMREPAGETALEA
ncbi:hypothetical protein [Euryhalocaulis sp.]|uniref:hypothetical protein n=1 Tax=Euryhalocaulis sp. TaxID=2744307 RepID=UPI00257F6472|nr:hypothetical protein [Euryhalocaulis sp.]